MKLTRAASLERLRGAALARLPQRLTEAQRAQLAQRITVAVHRWQDEEPLFPPEKDKRRRLVPTVERLKRALVKVQTELASAVAQDLEQREAMMIRREASGLSAVVDLNDVAAMALAGLEEWERRYRPKRNQSLAGSGRLTERLRAILCCEGTMRLSAAEFENVLDTINATFAVRLSTETLKRRGQRRTDKPQNAA